MKQKKSCPTFSSSDSSFMKYPEVSLYNLSFFIFCFKCAMDLFLSYESPPLITCIYVNSFRDCMMMDSIDTDFYLFIYLINSVFKTMIMFFSN